MHLTLNQNTLNNFLEYQGMFYKNNFKNRSPLSTITLPPYRFWINTTNDIQSLHWHSTLEIIMPFTNTYSVTINQQFYQLSPGEILLISPGDLHSISLPDKDSGMIAILMIDVLDLYHNPKFKYLNQILQRTLHITEQNTPPEILQKEQSCIIQMLEMYFLDDELKNMSIASQFFNLMLNIGRNLKNQTGHLEELTSLSEFDHFNKCMKYIQEHCHEQITLDELAKTVGFSKFYFSRQFKQRFGVTVHDYITVQRLSLAEGYLINTDMSIANIAFESGFLSLSTFNRIFRANKGLSPSEYRRRMLKNY